MTAICQVVTLRHEELGRAIMTIARTAANIISKTAEKVPMASGEKAGADKRDASIMVMTFRYRNIAYSMASTATVAK